jgi:hypothetical protein
VYRALEQWGYAEGATNSATGSASYVTGSHNVKVGYQYYWLRQLDNTIAAQNQLAYRVQRGVANAVTYRLPEWSRNSITQLHGIFAQDQFTRGRLSVSGAVRWDRASSYAPVEGNGVSLTSKFNAQPITIEKTDGVNAWNDITPRVGVGYDVFGNGRTALKFRWGKYLGFASNDPPFTSNNPASTLVATVTNRGWTDNDNDWVVDCDLLNAAAQSPTTTGSVDTCVAATGNSANFGKIGAATRVDPNILSGWGVRQHDYQSEITLQQEVLPRVSAEVSYIHRIFNNQNFVTQNQANDPDTSYLKYTITAPSDPRLPDGGGYPILVYVANTTAAANNFLTAEKTFGERDSYYDGVNFNLNARMRNGLFMSLGTQTGRRVDDTCNVVTKYAPSNGTPNPRGCHDAAPFQTTVRGLGSYTLPKIDVLISATVRSQPPLAIDANWLVPNTYIRDTFFGGVAPPGFAVGPTSNSTINIVDNDHRLYVDNRRTQVDMRFAKVLRFGRYRADVGVDLWNLFNTNYATTYEEQWGSGAPGAIVPATTWQNPTAIYAPRFVRLNFTVDF